MGPGDEEALEANALVHRQPQGHRRELSLKSGLVLGPRENPHDAEPAYLRGFPDESGQQVHLPGLAEVRLEDLDSLGLRPETAEDRLEAVPAAARA